MFEKSSKSLGFFKKKLHLSIYSTISSISKHPTEMAASASAASDGEEITLVSKDGKTFQIPHAAAVSSGLINAMIEMHDEDDDDDVDDRVLEIPLPNVSAKHLSKVVEFLCYHKDHPFEEIKKPIVSNNMLDNTSAWDAAFIDELDQDTLFEIILASNYMDVKDLLHLGCAKVASMVKGKTTEELRKQFNIVNDFTPEEERQVREESSWAFTD